MCAMTTFIAARILVLAILGGVLADLLVPGHAPGLNAPLLVAVLLAAALWVAGWAGLRRMDPADAWLAPAALLFAGFAAVRADPWLVGADLVFAAVLATGAIGALGGGRITRGAVPAVLEVAARSIVAVAAGIAEVGLVLLRPLESRMRASGWHRPRVPGRAGPVLRGAVIALPLLLLFGLLFSAADAVFASAVTALLRFRIDLDFAAAAEHLAVVVAVAWGVAGLLAMGSGALRGASPAEPRSLGAASATAPLARPGRGLGTVEATTVLVLLDLLFAAFVVLQIAYLFGGLDTLAATGLTYAEYARRGFFELVAVAALAGTVVAVLDLAAGGRSRAQLGASLALLGLTGVVLMSAFERLGLYQAAYGWTELRFVVLVAIGWLAAALLAAAVLLARRRSDRILHVLGVLVLVTLGGMNIAGPQAFVAERNLERALDPSLVAPGGRTGLDHEYLAQLGDEAVPAVVAALERLDAADRVRLDAFLRERERALATDPSLTGWPSWNLARERARDALRRQSAAGAAGQAAPAGSPAGQ
jgi:hypothetical protein